jgi:hypothetical protein
MSACALTSVSETDFLANVFDALPLPALVVDSDVRVVEFNVAASKLLANVPFAVLRPSAGEALHCIHSAEASPGCGHAAACQDCVIRNSVREVFGGGKPGRRIARMAGVNLLVTVASIPDDAEPLALLILDDAAELSAVLTPASSSPGSKARAKARGRKTGNS